MIPVSVKQVCLNLRFTYFALNCSNRLNFKLNFLFACLLNFLYMPNLQLCWMKYYRTEIEMMMTTIYWKVIHLVLIFFNFKFVILTILFSPSRTNDWNQIWTRERTVFWHCFKYGRLRIASTKIEHSTTIGKIAFGEEK